MTSAMCVALVLILIPLALVIALHIPSVQKELITWGTKQIESSTNYKIELQSYKWFPFSKLHLSNVHVQADGRQILTCEDVSVSYSLSVSSPFLVLQDIYLKKPLIQLERSPDGKWLIPGVKPGAGQGGQPGHSSSLESFHLPNIHIDAGKIEASQQGTTVLSIKDITGILHLKSVPGPNGPSIRLDLDNWRAEADSSEWGKWTITCSGSLHGNQLIIQNAAFSGENENTPRVQRPMEYRKSRQWEGNHRPVPVFRERYSRSVPGAFLFGVRSRVPFRFCVRTANARANTISKADLVISRARSMRR